MSTDRTMELFSSESFLALYRESGVQRLSCGSKLPVACISGSSVLYTRLKRVCQRPYGGVIMLFFCISLV